MQSNERIASQLVVLVQFQSNLAWIWLYNLFARGIDVSFVCKFKPNLLIFHLEEFCLNHSRIRLQFLAHSSTSTCGSEVL